MWAVIYDKNVEWITTHAHETAKISAKTLITSYVAKNFELRVTSSLRHLSWERFFSKMLTTLSYIRRADRVANSMKLQLSLPVEPWKLASTNISSDFCFYYTLKSQVHSVVFVQRCLRWLNTVSSTYIWMGRYNHSLSLDATIMVSKKLLSHWWTRCHHFFDIIGYHSNSMTS